MAIPLPSGVPVASLTFPPSPREIGQIEMTNGDILYPFIESDTATYAIDANGPHFYGTNGGMAFAMTVPRAPYNCQRVTMRLRAIVPLDSYGSAVATTEAMQIASSSDGTDWNTFFRNVGADTSVDATACFMDLRLQATRGGVVEWSRSMVVEGSAVEDSGSFALVGDLQDNAQVELITTKSDPAPPESFARIYGVDIWHTPVSRGMWNRRQRQTAGGNAGGYPSRQRQNFGHSGAWPERQRQTGI